MNNSNGARSDHAWGRCLGLFSLGLGVAEIAAPNAVARLVGVPARPGLLRAVGVREVLSGIGLIAAPSEPGWRWARVAGDLMDLALLGSAASKPGADRAKAAGAAMAVMGITAVDVAAGASGERHSRDGAASDGPIRAVVTVNREPQECYARWSEPGVLERTMTLVESVQARDDGRTHWKARLGNRTAEWDAEYTEQVPDQRLSWRSLPGGQIETSGSVRFDKAPGGRGTIVRLEMTMPSAGGLAGKFIGRQKARKDLLRFKQFMELGFIPSSDGPSGPRGMVGKLLEKAEE